MKIIMGIDEAGYGPLLGPLVIACSCFVVPNYHEEDLWITLQKSVGKKKKKLGDRLLVTDSKKAYSRSCGIKHLEQTTLAFLDQMRVIPLGFSHLLSLTSPTAYLQLQKYPWHSKTHRKFLHERNVDATIKLCENMENQGIELLNIECRYLDVVKFNDMIHSTGNKADIVIQSVLKLIKNVIKDNNFFDIDHIAIVCDRLGGRTYYKEILESLQGFTVNSIEESNKISKYRLVSDKLTLDISFEVGADNNHLPVALASMIGKYIREKVIEYMNEYFIELQPGLKPTAGYWTDGLRFLRDLKDKTLERANTKKEDLTRIK